MPWSGAAPSRSGTASRPWTSSATASRRSSPVSTASRASPSSPRACSTTSPPNGSRLLWARIAGALDRFPSGLYLSDLHLAGGAALVDRAFATALGAFVRGRVHFHFDDAGQAEATLLRSGFTDARLHAPDEYADVLPGMRAAGADRVRVVEARTRRA